MVVLFELQITEYITYMDTNNYYDSMRIWRELVKNVGNTFTYILNHIRTNRPPIYMSPVQF